MLFVTGGNLKAVILSLDQLFHELSVSFDFRRDLLCPPRVLQQPMECAKRETQNRNQKRTDGYTTTSSFSREPDPDRLFTINKPQSNYYCLSIRSI